MIQKHFPITENQLQSHQLHLKTNRHRRRKLDWTFFVFPINFIYNYNSFIVSNTKHIINLLWIHSGLRLIQIEMFVFCFFCFFFYSILLCFNVHLWNLHKISIVSMWNVSLWKTEHRSNQMRTQKCVKMNDLHVRLNLLKIGQSFHLFEIIEQKKNTEYLLYE